MTIVEEHRSADGLLHLLVKHDADGDTTIGFAGGSWHTHGDVLASLSDVSQQAAIREFVDRIIGDRQLLAISRVDGSIRDLWPVDDIDKELKYRSPDESLEFRYFSGKQVEIRR